MSAGYRLRLRKSKTKNNMKIYKKKAGEYTFYSTEKITKDEIIAILIKQGQMFFSKELFISKGLASMTIEDISRIEHNIERFNNEKESEKETADKYTKYYRECRSTWEAEYKALKKHLNQ